jgi:RimJ/RimL family protein N-acetyltransferase
MEDCVDIPDVLVTKRLILRRWRPEDEVTMDAINRDPEVTRLLNRPLDEASLGAFYGLIQEHWATHGYGPWAVQLRGTSAAPMIGFAGLAFPPPFLAAAGPGPELGWRLSRSVWGHGYATEATTAARDDALRRVGVDQLFSIIHPENVRSQRVATKLGMVLDRQVDNPAIGRIVDVWTLGGTANRI